MVRDDIKNSSLLKTKFLIYAFNGRTKKIEDKWIMDWKVTLNAALGTAN